MNKHNAIFAVNSQVKVIRGDDAFDANGNPVTYDETAVQAYIEKRQQAYPSIADQLDILYHSGFDAWKSAIQAVKAKYPKG